ncbi:hypothetical protein WN48_10601 [Eufriesea mexicana]|uniref:SAP domain-containing protein n=1 Tax=Eufriesea mexicana TaxID=516756 RepID=A0A310S6G3_9HYME|nr:hypothetical protein WN48_10601 [Eufriesea mexicana]
MAICEKQTLGEFNIPELKEMLRIRGQSITGNKSELIARLIHHDPQIESRLRMDFERGSQEGINNPETRETEAIETVRKHVYLFHCKSVTSCVYLSTKDVCKYECVCARMSVNVRCELLWF